MKSMLRKCHGHGLTKGAIIQIFYHSLDKPTQGILDETASGIFLYKSSNQAFQLLEDKVLFNLNWSTNSQTEHHQISVSFADGNDSNTDNYGFIEKLKMKQNEKNFQTNIKNIERKIDEWSKSKNLSSKDTDRTEPPPPPQAHTEHVNTVFTGSGKSDDPLKT
nr:reverse transcriptase domain-containing protein [Tanacetum cinerariifolium]